MPQVKVIAPFGYELVGSIIDLDTKDAEQKVSAGLAEYVAVSVTNIPEPVQEEIEAVEGQ